MHQQQRTIRVGHYYFDKNSLLGKGSTGCVYLGTTTNDQGRDTENDRQVACKVVDMNKVTHEVTKFLLENEKAALRMLHHPNILKCFDIYQQERWCYIFTEYCNEGTLADLIKSKGRLSEDDALDIFDSIVEGYKLCVEKKIAHRDLKPANILMHDGLPKISDFGYCEVAGYPKPNSYYNVGSPCYMSPQALISSCYGEKSDVWSLGVILYEMLCGEPFDKPDEHMVVTLKNIFDSGGLHFPKGISPYCKKVIRGCLEFDVHKRFDVRKLLKVLEDSSDAEDTTIIEKFEASPEKDDIMRNNPLASIGNSLRQFQPNSNGVYSINNVPVALRAMLERQMRNQPPTRFGVPTHNNYHQHRQQNYPEPSYQDNNKVKRHSRVRSLDVRLRQISSAPTYKQLYPIKKVQQQPQPVMPVYPAISQQIRQVHNRYRPVTANHDPHMMKSLQHPNSQQYGKLLFKESADMQIPNVRYMNPIFPTNPQEAMDCQRLQATRSLSSQSISYRPMGWNGNENQQPPSTPLPMQQSYQQQQPQPLQRFPSNASIQSPQMGGFSPVHEVYGLRLNEQPKTRQLYRQQPTRPTTNYQQHPYPKYSPQQELIASQYFPSMQFEPRSAQYIRHNGQTTEEQLKC